jgi:hypothetical protein
MSTKKELRRAKIKRRAKRRKERLRVTQPGTANHDESPSLGNYWDR